MFIVLETLEEETRRVAAQVDGGDDKRATEDRFSHHRSNDDFSGAMESLEEVSFDTTQ